MRVTAYVRSSDNDVIGIGARMKDASGYLLTLDSELDRRRLVRLDAGVGAVLVEVAGGYSTGVDVFVAIEAVGARLRAFVNGELLFDVTDAHYASGRIALYSGQNAGTQFTDVRVDDLRRSGPTAYQFAFTTSAFTDFRHHLHSYSDQTFVVSAVDDTSLAGAARLGVAPTDAAAAAPPTEAEARAYDTFATEALGGTRLASIGAVDVTRLDGQARSRALIVRAAEPLDWTRVSFNASVASAQPIAPVAPGVLKLIAVSFATGATPNDQSVTVLLRDAANLIGWRIDFRILPGPSAGQHADGDELFAQAAADAVEGLGSPQVVWRPRFKDLREVALAQPVGGVGRPHWTATHGALAQTGSFRGPGRGFPGAHAISRAGTWTVFTFAARLRAQAAGKFGLLFRYENESTYHRFSIDLNSHVGRLVRHSPIGVTSLFVAPLTLTVNSDIDILVEVSGARIIVTLNGARFCDVLDTVHPTGRVGFYTYGAPIAFVQPFDDAIPAAGRRRLDAARRQRRRTEPLGARRRRAASDIGSPGLERRVGSRRAGRRRVERLSLGHGHRRLRRRGCRRGSFAWRDSANHCRFVLDGLHNERRLINVVNGAASMLWSGAGPFTVNTSYHIRIETVGDQIRVWLDGLLLTEAIVAPATGRAGVVEATGGDVHGRVSALCSRNRNGRRGTRLRTSRG